MFGSLGQIAKALDEQSREARVNVKTAAEIRNALSPSSTETTRQPSFANDGMPNRRRSSCSASSPKRRITLP